MIYYLPNIIISNKVTTLLLHSIMLKIKGIILTLPKLVTLMNMSLRGVFEQKFVKFQFWTLALPDRVLSNHPFGSFASL